MDAGPSMDELNALIAERMKNLPDWWHKSKPEDQ